MELQADICPVLHSVKLFLDVNVLAQRELHVSYGFLVINFRSLLFQLQFKFFRGFDLCRITICHIDNINQVLYYMRNITQIHVHINAAYKVYQGYKLLDKKYVNASGGKLVTQYGIILCVVSVDKFCGNNYIRMCMQTFPTSGFEV